MLRTLRNIFWVGLLCVVSPAILPAQVGGWARLPDIGSRQGLPSTQVYSVLVENSGQVLLGTESGLYRYNGASFRQIPQRQLHSSMIDVLTEGSAGTIFCQDHSGNLFQLERDSLKLVRLPLLGKFQTLLQNNAGDIFAIGTRGIARWRPRQLTWQTIFLPALKNYDLVSFTVIGDTIYGTPRSTRLVKITFGKNTFSLEHFTSTYLDFTLFSYKNVLIKSNFKGGKLAPYRKAPDNPFRELPIDERYIVTGIGQIGKVGNWVSTSKGLFVQPVGQATWHRLNTEWVTDLELDSEGTLWVTTLNNGIQRFTHNGIRAYNYNQDIFALGLNLQNEIVAGLSEGRVARFSAAGEELGVRKIPEAYPVQNIFFNLNQKAGIIHHTGFGRIDHLSTKLKQVKALQTWDISENYLLFNRYRQVLLYSFHLTRKDHFQVLQPYSSSFRAQNTGRIRGGLIGTGEQYLFVATDEGMLRIGATQIDTLYLPGKAPFIARNICHYRPRNYLAATYEKGLWSFNQTGAIQEITDENGTRLEVTAMQATPHGAALATAGGIRLLHPRNGLTKALNEADGLLDTEIRALTTAPGGLWVASASGLQFIPYSAFWERYQVGSPYIRTIRLNGLPVKMKLLKALPSDYQTVTLGFGRNTLRYRNRLRFAYRLANGGKEWQALPPGENEVTLFSLKPGNYTLELRSSVQGLPGATHLMRIPITVRPAWYARWWFWGAVIVLLFSGGGAIYAYRIRRIRQKAAYRARLSEAELSALRAQMNPHFIFNALNSLQSAILKADTMRAMRLLKTFSDLLRTTVDYARAKQVPLHIELQQLQRYIDLQRSRFGEELCVEMNFPAQHQTREIPAMFIIPFVENAFEHGLRHKIKGVKQLTLEMNWQPEQVLHVIIEDNGVGRAAARALQQRQQLKKHKSFGLLSVQERLKLYNQPGREPIRLKIIDLTDENQAPQGTRIELSLPAQTPDVSSKTNK